MKRRVPYVDLRLELPRYICPNCRTEVSREFYKKYDYCDKCLHPVNRTSKGMIRFYQLYDLELYNIFIEYDRR